MKKSWMVVDAKTLRKEDVQKETVYCLNDDDETEIQKEDVVQGMASALGTSKRFFQGKLLVKALACQ